SQVRPSSKKESRVRLTIAITSTRRAVSGNGRGAGEGCGFACGEGFGLACGESSGPAPGENRGAASGETDTVESATGSRAVGPSSCAWSIACSFALHRGVDHL